MEPVVTTKVNLQVRSPLTASAEPGVLPQGTVTAAQLREILSEVTFDDDKVSIVLSLAPQIADKAGAAKVIADTFTFDDDKASAIAALNGREIAPTRVRIESPTVSDRLGGFADGLLYPLRNFVGVSIISAIGAWAFGELGVHLGDIPVMNILATVSNTKGFGADVLAALTGTMATGAVVGGVRGFVEPKRSV